MNQDSYNSNSLSFDQPQPPQSPVIHQPPQELSIQEMEDLKQQHLDELKRLSNLEYRDENKIAELTQNFNGMSIEIRKKEKLLQLEQWAYLSTHPSKRFDSFCYDDDDEDYTLAVTPSLSTEEPYNSLSMVDKRLDTIPATKLDELIKSSVEDLISIPSESEGIPDHVCDVPFHENSPPLDVSKDQFEDFSESNDEFSSTDDDSFSIDNIDYVEASPPDSELVSSEVKEIFILEVGGIDDDILLTIKADILQVDAFLTVEDEPFSSQFPQSYLDPEGDILLLKAFLNDDHSSDFKTKTSSTSLNSLLEETKNFDNSLPEFTTLSNVLFDAKYESNSSDDQSCSDEDVSGKIVLKPLFEEEIIPMKIDQLPDNAESDLMKSLRTHDSSLPISSKIDSLLDEFADELTLLKSIPPGIDDTDCDFKEDIRLIEKLLYNNSSPRPPKEFVYANSYAKIESFSPSPILVKDSDSLMEEIDLFCTPDYPMPPGIKDDDYDSERGILILKDLPSNNTLSFAKKESFHFDIPPFSRPPAKPPDGDTGILNIKRIGERKPRKRQNQIKTRQKREAEIDATTSLCTPDAVARDGSRSTLSQLCHDVVTKFQMPSSDRSRRRRFMLTTPSPHSVCMNLQVIWCSLSWIKWVFGSLDPKILTIPSSSPKLKVRRTFLFVRRTLGVNAFKVIIEEKYAAHFEKCGVLVFKMAQRSFDAALCCALERIITTFGPSLLACRLSCFDILMALWQSQIEDYTSDWLRAVTISGVGQNMNGYDKPLRPADILLYSWDEGLDVCVDLMGSSPLTQTDMVDFVPNRAMIDATHRKRVKYEAKCVNIEYGFLPFSFSLLEELDKDAVNLLKRIQKFFVTQDIRACGYVHIFNRINFPIAKRVGAQLVSRLSTNFL
nr:hypothetical protein [Tanacetum cinerariifolium]